MKPVRAVIVSAALCIAYIATGSPTNAHAQSEAARSEAPLRPVAASDARAAKAANRALRKFVIRQLSRTRGLDVGGINVTAANGVVTLVGTVPDTRQIDLASEVAGGVTGVREVHNSLTLQTNGK